MRLMMPMLLGGALFLSGLVPQTPSDAPAARGGHAMTYDSHHGLALMFGGGSRQQSFNDLWAWNGKRWQRLAESGPSPRDSSTFAYDSKRNRAIVVGGRSINGLVDDTWEWDGTQWHERKVSGPGIRLHHFAAFDVTARTSCPLRWVEANRQNSRAVDGHVGVGWRDLDQERHRRIRGVVRWGTAISDAGLVTKSRRVCIGGQRGLHARSATADLRRDVRSRDTWEFTGTAWERVHPR